MYLLKKGLRILGFSTIYMLVLGSLLYVSDTAWAATYSSGFGQDVALILGNIIMLGLLKFYRRKTENQWVKTEAERWILARAREQTSPTPRWRKKLGRCLLWAPSASVMLTFLFLPEMAGLVSHLYNGRLVNLGRYQIKTPITWVNTTDGQTYLWTLAAPGIGRIGLPTYWSRQVPVSSSSFYPVAHPEGQLNQNVPSASATVIAKHSFPFGKETITCWDLIYNNKYVGPSITDPSIAEIGCSTESSHFYAHFFGWRGDSAAFYETLQRITITE